MSCTPTLPSATLFENAFYVGLNLECMLYGIELLLYFSTMRVFLARRREPRTYDVFYAIYSTVMVLLITIWVSAEASYGQKMWLLNRNYPGGPEAYRKTHLTSTFMDLKYVSIFILQQMTDGLMVHRCRIVWGCLHATVIPCILWLASFALGVVVTWASVSNPNTDFFSKSTAKFGLVFHLVSIVLNATVTCMICYRLILHARTAREFLGDRYASPYYTIITLLVESVLPYTLAGIAFIVSLGIKSQTDIGFSRVYLLMMCVSPQMLILRAARGKAWQKDTVKPPLSVMMLTSSHVTGLDSERRKGVEVGRGSHSVCLAPQLHVDIRNIGE